MPLRQYVGKVARLSVPQPGAVFCTEKSVCGSDWRKSYVYYQRGDFRRILGVAAPKLLKDDAPKATCACCYRYPASWVMKLVRLVMQTYATALLALMTKVVATALICGHH